MIYRDTKGTDLTPDEVDANFRAIVEQDLLTLQEAKDFAEPKSSPAIDNQVLVKNADGSSRYELYGGGVSSTPTGMDGHDTYLI